MNYKPVIGLEVHVELKTNSKMFCGCSADYFGKEPNTHTCPVCLGLPGALPVPNKKAIDWCIMIGLALNCKIPLFSKFDRKNYFYPDLSKGYQISQHDQPFCVDGYIKLSNDKKIGIRRVHMEEDTGKLIHQGKYSLIDFNRSGVPLVEIVTEPDFENPTDVKEYLKEIQKIVRTLGVSNADLERGDMRMEPNISLKNEGQKELPSYRVEVKNINSFKFVDKAIEAEIERQTQNPEQRFQATMRYDEKTNKTITMRWKEEAADYRYFPEPDIPPFRWTQEHIEALKKLMPELPNEKIKRFVKEYGLSEYDSVILTKDTDVSTYFEESVKAGSKKNVSAKQIANFIINKKISTEEVLPAQLIQNILIATKKSKIDENKLSEVIDKVILENPNAIEDYKKGKENAIMFLVGQCMRLYGEKIDAQIVKASLLAKLK